MKQVWDVPPFCSSVWKDPLSGLRSFSPVAQAAAAGELSSSGKRPYTEVEKEESELGLNSKQRKYLKFQKRFQRKSCKWLVTKVRRCLC